MSLEAINAENFSKMLTCCKVVFTWTGSTWDMLDFVRSTEYRVKEKDEARDGEIICGRSTWLAPARWTCGGGGLWLGSGPALAQALFCIFAHQHRETSTAHPSHSSLQLACNSRPVILIFLLYLVNPPSCCTTACARFVTSAPFIVIIF